HERFTSTSPGSDRNRAQAPVDPVVGQERTRMESGFLRRALPAFLAGVLALLALAAPSVAGPPHPDPGVACITDPDGDGDPNNDTLNLNDSEISGRGSTFAARAWNALAAGYASDVCGSSPVHYNLAGLPNGSSAGQRGQSWRNEMFGGTDIPYDQNTL